MYKRQAKDGNSAGRREWVRVIVSTGNAMAAHYGGMPDTKTLVGLWWCDFPCHRGPPQPPSPFRETLVDHIVCMLMSRKQDDDAMAAVQPLMEILGRTCFARADKVGTTLVTSRPGNFDGTAVSYTHLTLPTKRIV